MWIQGYEFPTKLLCPILIYYQAKDLHSFFSKAGVRNKKEDCFGIDFKFSVNYILEVF